MNYKFKDVLKKPDLQMIIIIGIMTALEIVLHRMVSIQTPIIQIHLGFVPVVIIAYLYGPLYAGLNWAMADVIGTLLFPTGAFFPGFTITALLSGFIFGIFLYKSDSKIINIILSVAVINIFFTLLLDMYWLYLLTGDGFVILLPSRLIKCAVMIPTQIIITYIITKSIQRIIKRRLN